MDGDGAVDGACSTEGDETDGELASWPSANTKDGNANVIKEATVHAVDERIGAGITIVSSRGLGGFVKQD